MPANARPGTTYPRFRFSTEQNLTPTGQASDGEVEDYGVAIQAPGVDLKIVKTASPDSVLVGQDLTYTLVVTNQGLSTATGVMVQDLLPSDTTYVSATPSQGTCSQAAGVVTSDLGTMPGSRTATVTIVVTVDSASSLAAVAAEVAEVGRHPR